VSLAQHIATIGSNFAKSIVNSLVQNSAAVKEKIQQPGDQNTSQNGAAKGQKCSSDSR